MVSWIERHILSVAHALVTSPFVLLLILLLVPITLLWSFWLSLALLVLWVVLVEAWWATKTRRELHQHLDHMDHMNQSEHRLQFERARQTQQAIRKAWQNPEPGPVTRPADPPPYPTRRPPTGP